VAQNSTRLYCTGPHVGMTPATPVFNWCAVSPRRYRANAIDLFLMRIALAPPIHPCARPCVPGPTSGVIGEVDTELDGQIDLEEVMAQPIPSVVY
jgi:hypothetical protein